MDDKNFEKLLDFVTEESEAIYRSELLEEAKQDATKIEYDSVQINLPKNVAYYIKTLYQTNPLKVSNIVEQAFKQELLQTQ